MHILHLEDDGPLREILATALRAVEPDCELHQFTGSDAALEYAEKNLLSIDLFILDIRVPGSIDGLQLAQKLRDLKCSGVIVMTSAFRVPSPEILERLKCEWYPKPWHIFETSERLLKLAREKREQAALAKAIEAKPPDTAPLDDTLPKTAEVVVPERAANPELMAQQNNTLQKTAEVVVPAQAEPPVEKLEAPPPKAADVPILAEPVEAQVEANVDVKPPPT